MEQKNKLIVLCSQDKRAAIIDAISHRVPFCIAVEANGVSLETFNGWIAKAKQDMDAGIDSEHIDFYTALKRAEMTKMREHLDVISARPDNWQADAWILERVWPEYYSI